MRGKPTIQKREVAGPSQTTRTTEPTPEVVRHEVSVSLGIVGHNGWVRMTRPFFDLAGFRVAAGFDSGRGDCGDRNGMGRACWRGVCNLIFAS